MIQGNKNAPGNDTKPGALDMINASFLNYLARGVNHGKKNSTFSFLRQDPLTAAAFLGMVKVPNHLRSSRDLTRAPHGEKIGVFCFRCRNVLQEISTYRREHRSAWRERAAALSEPGSLCSRLFLCLYKPSNHLGGHHG